MRRSRSRVFNTDAKFFTEADKRSTKAVMISTPGCSRVSVRLSRRRQGGERDHSHPSCVPIHPALPVHSHPHEHSCCCNMASAGAQDPSN